MTAIDDQQQPPRSGSSRSGIAVVDRVTEAPAPRTLLDILRETVRLHPDSAAIDDPAGTLVYSELLSIVEDAARRLTEAGVRRGDRVGVRLPSGTRGLYVAILSVLAAGAAYVPVDADDPQERAELVFGEAGVVGVFTADGFAPVAADLATRTEGPQPPG